MMTCRGDRKGRNSHCSSFASSICQRKHSVIRSLEVYLINTVLLASICSPIHLASWPSSIYPSNTTYPLIYPSNHQPNNPVHSTIHPTINLSIYPLIYPTIIPSILPIMDLFFPPSPFIDYTYKISQSPTNLSINPPIPSIHPSNDLITFIHPSIQ